jgi:hypothetical protein
MHHLAPNPAAEPHLSLNTFIEPSLSGEEHNASGDRPSFYGTQASSTKLRFGRTFAAEKREADFGPEGFIRLVSRLCTVTASGPIRRPAARRSSASTPSPFGLRFPASPDPPQMQSLALGSRAHFAY